VSKFDNYCCEFNFFNISIASSIVFKIQNSPPSEEKVKNNVIASYPEVSGDEAISKMNYEFLTCLPAGRF